MGRKSKAKFELKGHTLPGINQKSETSNLKDGKSPSSALQMQSPMKETTMPSYGGVKIDPTLSYKYKSAKIPSFRDIISLEQQQDYAKRVDERRAKRKEDEQGARDAQAEYDRKVASGEITPSGPGEISQSEQQRKSLESIRQMEEEGRRLHPDPLEPKLQPLTLTEIEEKKKPKKKKKKEIESEDDPMSGDWKG